MKRKLLSLLLALVMILTLLPVQAFAVDPANPFRDVKQGDWCYDAVQYVRVNGFFNGTTSTTFSPNDTMTRGMFVTVMGRLVGVDTAQYQGKSAFTDVPEDAYFAPYVAWASQYGVTTGAGDGKFSPYAYINRQQMAAFFVRYFEAFGVDYTTGQNITTTPADIDSVSPYARDAVLKLWRQGLLNGDGVNFNPAGNATRAQTATVCWRLDQAVETWYKEPGVPSGRVKINPATGLPFDQQTTQPEEAKPSTGSSGGSGGSGGGGGGTKPAPSDSYSVRFYDGSRLIEAFNVKKGEPLGKVPSVVKSSKANYILEGYYTDSGFTTPFYAENPVTGNLNVYARYESMGDPETLTIDSFARMDQGSHVSFRFRRLEGTSGGAAGAVTLVVKDGSDPVEITVEDNGDGTYTVSAPNGFNPGCSYELKLEEGWTFLPEGRDTVPNDAIRTAAFSIEMEEVEKLRMSESIQYIQDMDFISYTYTDKDRQSHSVDVLPSNADFTGGGRFEYPDAGNLNVGDILCIHVNGRPDSGEPRDPMDPAVYAKVSGVSGNTVSFTPLDEEDRSQLYEIPDNFPIRVGALPGGLANTVNISQLDTALYAQMVGADKGTLENAKAALNVGDFVSLYVDSASIASESDICFGRVDRVEGDVIYFSKCSAGDIEQSADLYTGVEMTGEMLVTEEERAEIERTVLAQVQASSFGEDAAYLLLEMASQTDGFRNTAGLRDVLFQDGDGKPLSAESVRYLARNVGTKFELGDDVELKVELITSGNQLHFKNEGLQLAIGVEAEFEVDTKDEGRVHIKLSATFLQEVALDPSIKGSLVYKKILFIPIPTGVQINAIVDVKSFTAMSVKAEIFTEGPEDKNLWEQFQDFAKDPTALGDIPGLPDELKRGMNSVGDALKKIDEMKEEISKQIEDLPGYENYISDIWEQIEAVTNGSVNREEWEEIGEKLEKTDITAELMNLMNLTGETDLSTEYIDGLSELMDRYSELLEKETDWVTLVEQEMFNSHTPEKFGVMIGIQGKFMVRADLNLAIGSNLQYEVGKRYNFWFRIGLFKPTSGSSTMDLLDESFAFQFYVMGKIGLKAGVRMKIYAAIGSVDAVSVGLTTELGPYLKLWGFFIYDYSKMRKANTPTWTSKEQMAGALYLEFSLYLMAGVEAKALFLDYDKDFVDEEFPLLDAGSRYYRYGTAYEPLDESDEIVVYNNGSAALQPGCAVSMALPEETCALRTIDLTTGRQSAQALDFDNYTFKLSSPNFRIDNVNGRPVISVVSIPQNVRLMQCDLTITYKHGKLAFSTYDMTATVHLAWTNMTAAEYQQVYTAAVTVPDGSGGREAVWTQRVRKGTPFNLPTEEEIQKLLSWSGAKYVAGSGYGGQPTEGVTLIQNTQYNYDLGYQTYQLTVTGIEGGGGGSRTFTGKYGEPFDFSSLLRTGEELPGVRYTRFAGLMMDGQVLPLNQPITGKFAASQNAIAEAQYVDETVTATFEFTGIDHAPIEVRLRSGEIPDTRDVLAAVPADTIVTGFYPAVGPIDGDMTYQVVCQGPDIDIPVPHDVTISFQSNGGSEVADITRTTGGVLGTLPTPTRTGYSFDGWFTDDGTFENPVDVNTIVAAAMTLYAKWTAGGVTVIFNTNGGLNLTESTKTVAYGRPYGELPVPENSGYGFVGWFTAADETGTEVTAETVVNTTDPHTLYAHWVELKTIPSAVFDFGGQETFTYDKSGHTAEYTFNPGGDLAGLTADSFTISYTRLSDEFRAENTDEGTAPVTAGSYIVHVTREADNTYAKFDQTYGNTQTDAVLVIERATRDLSSITDSDIVLGESGITYQRFSLSDACKERIDLEEDNDALYIGGTVRTQSRTDDSSLWTYTYDGKTESDAGGLHYSKPESGVFYGLCPSGRGISATNLNYGKYVIKNIKIAEDINYEDAASGELTVNFTLGDIGSATNEWWSYVSLAADSWYNEHKEETDLTIQTSNELAYIISVSDEEDFTGKTITLACDLDMSRLPWGTSSFTRAFNGTFDGGGHTITGMWNGSTRDSVSLFRELGPHAVVKNLTLDDSWFAASSGGVAESGDSSALLQNVTSYVSSRNSTVLPLVGGSNAAMENCAVRIPPTKSKN